ncbi:MAG: 6-phosphogluconolactonase [Desulfobulbales bacterium]|nr:6-phosphogluconolactonase [Desulfobulbales bacterium]
MVREFTNIQEASKAAVKIIIDIARSAAVSQGFCSIVLAGGSTPRQTYELLGEPRNAEQMPWQTSHFFWGDERWVASTHQESNYSMADKSFLSKVHIPEMNIHRISTGYENPSIGAAGYEKLLREFFISGGRMETDGMPDGNTFPSFDLILLGMGADGHTASLFPGSALLEEKQKWVVSVPTGIGSPPVARITLTLPVINQAKNILFLISGRRKRQILDTMLARPAEAERLFPAARIKPAGSLVWLVAEQD